VLSFDEWPNLTMFSSNSTLVVDLSRHYCYYHKVMCQYFFSIASVRRQRYVLKKIFNTLFDDHKLCSKRNLPLDSLVTLLSALAFLVISLEYPDDSNPANVVVFGSSFFKKRKAIIKFLYFFMILYVSQSFFYVYILSTQIIKLQEKIYKKKYVQEEIKSCRIASTY